VFIPLYDDNPLRHLSWPYVNYALIAFTVVCFLLTSGFHQSAIDAAAVGYGFIPAVVSGFEAVSPQDVPAPVTYVTYAFLHVGWLHLLGNMAFLWVFGDNVEDALGHFRYLLFYLACAAAAAFVHSLFFPDSPAPLIGASGAVAGVVGAYLVLHPRVKLWILLLGRIPLRLSAMWVLGGWVVFQVFNVVAAAEEDSTAWWAHIGGLAVGAGLVVVFRRRGVTLLDRNLPKPG
jgi:membrane associated rhomboid family serine protease